MADHPNHVKTTSLAWEKSEHGERFASERKRVGPLAGSRDLGCSIYRIPPGKTAFPHHLHHGIEEAIYILAGQGTMRVNEQKVPVEAGDYFAFPVSGPAHQLLNTSGAPLEYLCISTMVSPEVVEYPDSGKAAMMVMGPGKDVSQRRLVKIFKQDSGVGYYDGE